MNVNNAIGQSWKLIWDNKYKISAIIALIVSLGLATEYTIGVSARSHDKTVSMSIWMPENPTVLNASGSFRVEAVEEAQKLSVDVGSEQMASLSKGSENTVIFNTSNGAVYYLCHKNGLFYLSAQDVGNFLETQAEEADQGAYLVKGATIKGNTVSVEVCTPWYWIGVIFCESLAAWFFCIYCSFILVFIANFWIGFFIEKRAERFESQSA